MNNSQQITLNQLFSSLSDLARIPDRADDALAINELCFLCLRIAKILISDETVAKKIAKEIGLILPSSDEIDPRDDLAIAFKRMEGDLEEGLRGFSGLLSWVLDEGRVRRDPSSMLGAVPKIDLMIKDWFLRLSHCLDVYFDLSEALDFVAPKAATAIFLYWFSHIYVRLYGEIKYDHRVVLLWLIGRQENDALSELLRSALRGDNLCAALGGECKGGKDALAFHLCLRIVDGGEIDQYEARLLDELLRSEGMLGIDPFIESGFLVLKGASSYREKSKGEAISLIRLK